MNRSTVDNRISRTLSRLHHLLGSVPGVMNVKAIHTPYRDLRLGPRHIFRIAD